MPRFVKPAHNGLVAILPAPVRLVREAERVLKAVRRLPGGKIVSIVNRDDHQQAFDVNSGGRVGSLQGHDVLLLALIASGLADGGGMIVRQFLPERGLMVGANGKVMDVPRKRLYGISLDAGVARPQDASVVRECMTVDCTTGAAIPEEELVEYATFPMNVGDPVEILRREPTCN